MHTTCSFYICIRSSQNGRPTIHNPKCFPMYNRHCFYITCPPLSEFRKQSDFLLWMGTFCSRYSLPRGCSSRDAICVCNSTRDLISQRPLKPIEVLGLTSGTERSSRCHYSSSIQIMGKEGGGPFFNFISFFASLCEVQRSSLNGTRESVLYSSPTFSLTNDNHLIECYWFIDFNILANLLFSSLPFRSPLTMVFTLYLFSSNFSYF